MCSQYNTSKKRPRNFKLKSEIFRFNILGHVKAKYCKTTHVKSYTKDRDFEFSRNQTAVPAQYPCFQVFWKEEQDLGAARVNGWIEAN